MIFVLVAGAALDFVVCDATTMKPRLAIELDDSSHNRDRKKQRDTFVDEVIACAKFRLVRVPARRTYVATALARLLKGQ